MDKNYEYEELSRDDSKIECKITVRSNFINELLDVKFAELAKDFKMPGFSRPGKVPIAMMKKFYKSPESASSYQRMVSDVLNDSVKITHDKVLADLEEDILESNNIKFIHYEDGDDFEYSVDFELTPKIPEIDLSGFHVDVYEINHSKEDLDECVSRMCSSELVDVSDSEYSAMNGDTVIIDFKGYVNEKEFKGGSAENFSLQLGAGQVIQDFNDGIVGVKIGEKRDVPAKFPEDYGASELAGQNAVFSINVRAIKRASSREELLQSQFDNDNNKLDEAAKNVLDGAVATKARLVMKRKLFDKLVSNCDFSLPNSMVAREKSIVEKNYVGDDIDDIVSRRVKVSLILSKFGKDNDIQVKDEDFITNVRRRMEMMSNLKNRTDLLKDNNKLTAIRNEMMEEAIVDDIMKIVKQEKVDISSSELDNLFEDV